jgi:hypothetical protein
MTLRDPKPAKKKGPSADIVAFRADEEMRRYLDKASELREMSRSEFIVEALVLDRRLGLELADVVPELRAYAEAHNLDMGEHLPEVLVGLVRAGLAAQKKGGRK